MQRYSFIGYLCEDSLIKGNMNTYRHVVYMVLDEAKGQSDDFTFNENHIIYQLNKYRAYLLKQKYYSDIKKIIPESNYQTIYIPLEKYEINESGCNNSIYMKSTVKLPYLFPFGNISLYPINYYIPFVNFISRERMKYVGDNKYLKDMLYASIAPDGYLYLKSNDPQLTYLKNIKLTALFENPEAAFDLQCPDSSGNTICNILDFEFPLEESLVSTVIDMTLKDLLNVEYRPEDRKNDASDTLSEIQIKK